MYWRLRGGRAGRRILRLGEHEHLARRQDRRRDRIARTFGSRSSARRGRGVDFDTERVADER